MPDPFSYIGEVLEQRLVVPPPPFGPPVYGWYTNQAIPAGGSLILFTDGTTPSSITEGAASVFGPDATPYGACTVEAIHSAEFHLTQLGFDWPGIFRLYTTAEIPADSLLLNVNAEIMAGHAFAGLLPINPGDPTYSDGVGLAKKAFEHYVFEHDPGQAPEAFTPRDGSAEGDPTTLAIETTEARHWRLIVLPFPGHYEDVALGGGSWAFIGCTLASWHGVGVPTEGPTLTAEAGWTALQVRYSRDGDDLKLDHFPNDGFPGMPILFPFFQAVTGASPRQFFGSLDLNWRSGTLFIAYRLSPPDSVDSPSIIHSGRGLYACAVALDGTIRFGRADFQIPPFRDGMLDTGISGRRSHVAYDPQWNCWRVLLQDLVLNVSREIVSYDGRTWADGVEMNGSFPRITINQDSRILRAIYVETDESAETGEIHGTMQAPGDQSPGEEFVFLGEDEEPIPAGRQLGFDISAAPGEFRRWLLSVGGTPAKHYVSADSGRTWKEVS